MQACIQWQAVRSWPWHIHTYFFIAHEKAKGQHDTMLRSAWCWLCPGNYCYIKKRKRKKTRVQNTSTGNWTNAHFGQSLRPSSELTQSHSNFSPRLIPLRCSEKRFKHLLASTAIQMYSASCHSGSSLSQPTSRVLQPRRLLPSPSIAPHCFSLLLWSALLSAFTPPA